MQNTLAERAIDGLHDYAIWLRERGDRSDVLAATREERAGKSPKLPSVVSRRKTRMEGMTSLWESQRLLKWAKEGRLTEDGTLRVTADPLSPWTLSSVQQAFPELQALDAWAVLIAADGICTEDEMGKDPHDNIREVIEEIVDFRLKGVLRNELSDIFAEVLGRVKTEREGVRVTPTGRLATKQYRVRHPVTKVLVTREELEAWKADNPEANN